MAIRLFLDSFISHGSTVILSKFHTHYLQKVMRCKLNDEVLLFNDVYGEWRGIIKSFLKDSCEVFIESQTRIRSKANKLYLAYAPIKQGCQLIVTQATELGVTDIIPVITDRTIVRKVTTEKLRQNAIEASQQSERLDVPVIHDAISLNDMLLLMPFEGNLLFFNERSADNLKKELRLSGYGHCILIGPEGGFTDREKIEIESHERVVSLSLGSRILKAGTASVAAISMYQSLYGHWE